MGTFVSELRVQRELHRVWLACGRAILPQAQLRAYLIRHRFGAPVGHRGMVDTYLLPDRSTMHLSLPGGGLLTVRLQEDHRDKDWRRPIDLLICVMEDIKLLGF